MKKKLPWFEIALTIVVLSAYLYAALSDAYNLPNRWFIRDDAYYYFKVAQNISEGHGSTFDGIHPTNGYHPLWMLVCIPIFALARFNLILPLRVLVIVTGFIQIGTGILLYRLVRSVISPPAAVLAAAFWLFDSYILVFLYKTGVESSIALFFILLLLTLAYWLETSWQDARPTRRQIALLAVVAALVVFSRLDLIFFALIFGAWIILRGSALRHLLPLDIFAIVLAALAAFLARLGFERYYTAATAAVIMLVVAAIIKVPVFYLLGLYAKPARLMSRSMLLRIVAAVALSSVMLSGVMLAGRALNRIPAFPRPALLYDAVFTLTLVLLIRIGSYVMGFHANAAEWKSPLDELRASWRSWLGEGALFYGVLGGSLAAYMLWNKLAFGSFSPVSGQIKRWWGTFLTSVYGGPPQSLLSFFGVDVRSSYNDWSPATSQLAALGNQILYGAPTRFGNPQWDRNFLIVLALALAIVLLILLLLRRRAGPMILQASIIPLFVGSWIQILSYSATGYASPKEWYWLTEPVLLVLLAAWLVNLLHELLLKNWLATRVIWWVLVGAVALRMGVSYWGDILALYPHTAAPDPAAYADVVPFLEANTPPGALIGMTGGGNVGYFLHNRWIVNMDGLINSPEYFNDLKAGTGSEYLYKSGMRYIFANPGILAADPYKGQYVGRLGPFASWGGKDLMRMLPESPE